MVLTMNQLMVLPRVLNPLRINLQQCVLQTQVLTCSVSSTEELLYLQLVSEPSVASRNRKRTREEAHTISSQFVRDSRNVSWLCRSWGRAKATAFILVSPSILLLWKLRFLCIKQRLWNMFYLSSMAYLHSCNMIRWLHVLWLSSCYFISMQDSHYLNNVIKFVISKQIRSVPTDMTDLGTNDEWNGQR